jgi:energy-coupling factor transporter ATP-binding protein EcfA2
MKIEVENCNNIDFAEVEIAAEKLNIKLAPNGTGKSTIAEAIRLGASGGNSAINKLMPFKLIKSNPDSKQPKVNGINAIKNVMCFNEDFVNQFVFKPEELIANSFDVFVKTKEYLELEGQIEELVKETKSLFASNKDLEGLIEPLKEMSDAFKLSNSGISKKSSGMKGLSQGNLILYIPDGLEEYRPFIRSDKSVSWIDWQTKGYEAFSALSGDVCPFCASKIIDKSDRIKKVGEKYEKNTIKYLIAITSIVDKLGEYLSEDARARMSTIIKLQDGIGDEHIQYIVNIKGQVDILIEKLERLRTLSGVQFENEDNIKNKLPSYKIELSFLSELSSDRTKAAVEAINKSIDTLIERAGTLQGAVNKQNKLIHRLVKKHQDRINDFLSYAGYKYEVKIVGKGTDRRLRLYHKEYSECLNGGNQNLSYGERNAFALVLFMYECLSKKPDMIILDDPISSFDKNKKYAILDMLFKQDAAACFKGKTVLMLTHDVEPVIDTIVSVHRLFNGLVAASYLSLENSRIHEVEIKRDDILTFSLICKNALASEGNELIKLIYLRRELEVLGDLGDLYQVISSLFHKRKWPTDDRIRLDDQRMKFGSFLRVYREIRNRIPAFSYKLLWNTLNDICQLKSIYMQCANSYERLQVFRMIDDKSCNTVVKKFINESYHIENEFICQLDPSKFNTIPEYILAECDKAVAAC